jgi:hypothetical protein
VIASTRVAVSRQRRVADSRSASGNSGRGNSPASASPLASSPTSTYVGSPATQPSTASISKRPPLASATQCSTASRSAVDHVRPPTLDRERGAAVHEAPQAPGFATSASNPRLRRSRASSVPL